MLLSRDPHSHSDLTIRSARARDVTAVNTVLKRSYAALLAADYPADILKQVLPAMSRAKPELLTLPTYYVGMWRGQIVAVGGWSASFPNGRTGAADVGHIRHVACDPDWLRRGITRALMRRSFESARAAGIRMLCCHSSRTAVPFYRAMGFEGEGEVELRMGSGDLFPAVEMRKLL